MFRRWYAALGTAAVLTVLQAPVVQAQDAPTAKETKKTDKACVAVFKLDGKLSEESAGDGLPFGGANSTSLKELVERLNKAATDPNVKAVVLLADGSQIGAAQREEVRQAMAKFRAGGKEIYAHSDSMGLGEFALLCGCTRVSVVPTGDMSITGMFGEAMFLRGLLDKLGVQPDFLTCGKYKSAAEQYMRTEPSPEAHAMQNWLMDSIFETYINMMAKGRGVDATKVKDWIDNGPYSAEKAKAAGLIDAVEHRQDFEAFVKSKCGTDIAFEHKYGEKKTPQLDLSNPFAIFKILGDAASEAKAKKASTKSAVGIVYVDGAISISRSGGISPFGATGGAYSNDIRKALDEAARDDSIKAVVLRVDSPGGSAVASEIILDATKRVKAKKPFVVSMGDVAGSGGYYVACAADTIFADQATITGSIGVVSGKLITNPMWSKIGVTFAPYQRGKNAGMLSSATPFSPLERERMQSHMDEIYGVFKGHVKAIRGDRLKKPIDDLAGGRVYTGKQALELGLVDKMGTMQDAVRFVAEQAKLSDYDVRVVPEPKNIIEQIMEQATGGKDDSKRLDTSAPRLNLAGPSLLDMAAPHLQHLDPQRVRMIRTALRQLQTLHQEGISLVMPEMLIP
jgi:protease IV